MIVFTKDNGIQIPNYDDLENKPKINGVTLEGDLTSAELGIDLDTTRYYTKTQSDNRFQPKGDYQPAGNYLTSVPSEYVTENELNNTLNQKDYATKTYVDNAIDNIEAGNVDLSDYYTKGEVDNLIDNVEVDLTGYATEQWVENKGYLTAVPSEYVTETELDNTLTNKNYATKSEIPTIPTNVSTFNNDAGYITENALNGYASENWVTENYQPKGDYLTSIPSEYVTESELNDAIAGLDGTDIPYVCIILNQNDVRNYMGDLQAVIEAVKNKSPYFAYAYTGDDPNDYGSDLGPTRTLIPLNATYNNNSEMSGYRTGYFGYHTELATMGNYPHLDVKINFRYDISTDSYILNGVTKSTHNYLTHDWYVDYIEPGVQAKLVSGTNIKTINGNSILGSGDLTIEAGSGGTNIPVLVLDLPRDTTTGAITGEVTIKSGNLNDITNAYVNNTPYLIYAQTELDTYAIPTDVFATDGLLTLTVISQGMDGSSSLKCWYYIQDNYDGTYFGQYTPYGQLATTDYVDTQIGNINTVLENIIG